MSYPRSISLIALLPVMALLLLVAGAFVYAEWGWVGLVPMMVLVLAIALLTGYALSRRMDTLARKLGNERLWEEPSTFAASHITELQKLDSAWTDAMSLMEQVFTAQRDFTANAAHELRTPLAALRLTGESALRTLDMSDTPSHDAIGAMLEEAERARSLVDRLLILARAESGRIPVDARQADVTEFVSTVVEWLTPLAGERGQRLIVESEDSCAAWVDENLLRMALSCSLRPWMH